VAMPSRGLTFHQEIQDAVAARERLMLVVGPKAALSDYVRQEWQFALQADNAVTPLLRSSRSCRTSSGQSNHSYCADALRLDFNLLYSVAERLHIQYGGTDGVV